MADISDTQQSEVIRITGPEETNVAEVTANNELKVTTNQVAAGDFQTYMDDVEVVLSSDTTYDVLYSVSGQGSLIGATFVVDNTEVECKIELDGNTVFEFTGDFLQEVVNKDADYKASGIFSVTGDGKRLYFTPTTPFGFSSSLTFSARKSGKKVKYQLYTYSVT